MASFFQSDNCTGTVRPQGEFTGCLKFGGCSKGQALPEEGHVLAPWVMIEFEGQGSIITVGNSSSDKTDQKHTSVIKSFEYGHQDGMTVNVVIHDQQGGSFEQFMANLLKNWACLDRMKKEYRMKFQFGWVKSGCNTPLPSACSPIYYAVMDAVESNYAEGKFMFEITGKDMGVRMMEGSTSQTWGADGIGATSIKEALIALLTNSCPPNVASVKFLKMENGVQKSVNFYGGGDGPVNKWEGLAQDKLHVARRWINGTRTQSGRGWVMEYNPCEEGGEVIFWEDRQPIETAQGDAYWDATCIGTYIVNGGKSSPVIEFNPKIRWDFGTLVSEGGSSSQLSTAPLPTGDGGVKSPGRREVNSLTRSNVPCAGKPLNMSEAPQHLTDDYGEEAQDKNQQAQAENLRAFKIEAFEEIQADLVIIGDPTLRTQGVAAKNCTIVFINPFQILRSKDGKPEWLNEPPCNPVLSNKGWIIKYITHKIELGNYTTTLGVFLTAPGKHLGAEENLGGWTGGWKPNNCK